MTLQCTPTDADLAHAARRGRDRAVAEGVVDLGYQAERVVAEILAAWPHVDRDAAVRAAAAVLPPE